MSCSWIKHRRGTDFSQASLTRRIVVCVRFSNARSLLLLANGNARPADVFFKSREFVGRLVRSAGRAANPLPTIAFGAGPKTSYARPCSQSKVAHSRLSCRPLSVWIKSTLLGSRAAHTFATRLPNYASCGRHAAPEDTPPPRAAIIQLIRRPLSVPACASTISCLSLSCGRAIISLICRVCFYVSLSRAWNWPNQIKF